MPSYFPVAITGTDNGQLSGELSAVTAGPFVYADNLYIVIEDLDIPESQVWKSTDQGATWTQMDGANAIPSGSTPFFDGDQTIVVAWRDNGVGLQDVHLRNFDLSTDTWGSDYASGGPQVPGNLRVVQVYVRPDGTIVIFYPDDTSAAVTMASVYDPVGTTWGSAIDMMVSAQALSGYSPTGVFFNSFQMRGIMDSDGRIHAFVSTLSLITTPAIWSNRVFYQALEPDDTLGAFYDFPGQSSTSGGHQDLEVTSGPVFGQPAILDGNLLLPVMVYNRISAFPREYPALYLGGDMTSPSWTIDTSLSLDPETFIDDSLIWMESPAFWTDGNKLVALGPAQTGDPDFTAYGRLRLTQSTDTANPDDGWSGTTIWDVDVDPTFGTRMSIGTVRITAGQIQVSTDFIVGIDEARYWMGTWNPAGVFLRNTFE